MGKSEGDKILKYLYKYYPDQKPIPLYHRSVKIKIEAVDLRSQVLGSLEQKGYAKFGGGWEKLGQIINPVALYGGLQTLDKYKNITGCLQKDGYEYVKNLEKTKWDNIKWWVSLLVGPMLGFIVGYLLHKVN